MHETRVASRYAKSLLEFAKEKGIVEEIKNDMSLFVSVCEENTALLRTLKNPIIPHAKKRDILNAIFIKKFNKVTGLFFDIISKKNREGYLYDICKAFINQYRELKGLVKANVVTTTPLTEDQRVNFISMVAKMTGKKAELFETIDGDIIGGFILTVGDLQIDESIKSKLTQLKSSFSYNPYLSKI
jgi:F-type H+-transporting ATPase subunit delta